ncbi:FHA domain-containing protein [Paenibacillus glacialis]|uniref:FHA domain-containing protein n=1 Tax=Paenibacillus glacialis TaxID=494026 RepID=A0A168N7M4_9BACL|nr:FHA domain-containing protein [Paenibacillus glacialis]OAB45489.1 hypothetical protein PGLA_04355 [Paenibacillus glacialis]
MKARKTVWIIVIDVIMYGILAGIILYTLLHPEDQILKISVTVGAAFFVGAILLQRLTRRTSRTAGAPVVKLVLLDDDGERIKEWYIEGETSLLIGKSSQRGEVDIDLSECEYASLISSEHAVLNRAGARWFIEDMESNSGTGIRQAGKSTASKLVIEEPLQIGTGDLIYIANTRLLVK